MLNNLPLHTERGIYFQQQRQTLTWLIVTTALAFFVWVWISNFFDTTQSGLSRLISFAILALCIVSYALRQRSFRLSAGVFVGMLWISNAIAIQVFDAPIYFYLFVPLTLIACALFRNVIGACVAVLSSCYIIINISRAGIDGWPPLIVLWCTTFVGMFAFHALNQVLRGTWNYLDYAIGRMDEAREHRGELAQLNATLNKAQFELQSVNSQLRYARHAAEEGRRLKAQFAANVSHELRMPINLIVGFSEMIVTAPEAYGAPLPTAYRSDMHAIYRNAKHLQSLIQDVLDMSRIEAGQMSIVKEACDPAQIIREAAALARDMIERKGLTFEVNVPAELPTMWLDRTRIRQVILNLLNNAIRFTDNGKITLNVLPIESKLRISVADTGLGIAKSDLTAVFEEYRQLESSLSRRFEGSGLGLTLSKQFVELHGGRIWVESEGQPGRGSTFYVVLPTTSIAVDWQPHLQQFQSVTHHEENNSQCLIIVERSPAVISLFERYVGTDNYQPIAVQDISEVGRVIDMTNPVAVVINEAFYTKEEIATLAEGITRRIPLIICRISNAPDMNSISASSSSDKIKKVEYLSEPVSLAVLASTINRLSTPVQNVVVIGDERDIVQMYKRMLQHISSDYKIWTAFSRQEGIALSSKKRPDLVLLVSAAATDKAVAVEQLTALSNMAATPIIVTSDKRESGPDIQSCEGAFDDEQNRVDGELTTSKKHILSLMRSGGLSPLALIRTVEALLNTFTTDSESAQ